MFSVLIVLGLVLLVVVSVRAGVVLAGERNRVAELRLSAHRHQLWRWEQELLAAAATRGCPGCDLLRPRAELQRPISD